MGEAFAVVAALAFAIGTVLQQKGTLATEAGGDDPRFLLQVLRKPVWLAGMIFQVVGWILQAVALDRAPLVVVQSLTALSLVIALPIGVLLTNQRVPWREISRALLTLVGIVIFVTAGQPQGGTSHPSSRDWWTVCLVTAALVALLGLLGTRFRGAEKAITLGVAAGHGFGLQAAVTKTFVTQIGDGEVALLTSWPVYVLIVSVVAGFVLLQSALKTGVLAPAMASSNSVTLFVSVLLGITVYGERISKAGGDHAGAAFIGLAVAIGGIILLAGAAPPEPAEPQVVDAPT